MEILTTLFVLGIVGVLALLVGSAVVKNLLYICGPNEVLVFSGSVHQEAGRPVGYRVIKGGRSLRIPLMEEVDRMDLTNMIIDVQVANAYSKGGIPLKVHGVANLKVAGHQPLLGNAIERLMGLERNQIIKVAKDTLEGNLRGVLSQLTPEEVNEDKLAFARKLLDEAEHDLSKLGLTLDTLKIQNVADDVGYLDSIGRKRSADVIKDARVAEAEAKAISMTREAEYGRAARISTIEAEMEVVRAETERRLADARTRREAVIAEELGKVQAQIARARADLDVWRARVEQVKRQLEADVVVPAQAQMEAQRAEAKGRASKIVEDGKATVAVLEEMIATWERGGVHAKDIFLMQKLQSLLTSLVGTIEQVKVDRITVLPGVADSQAQKAVRTVEELKGALGVDLPKMLERVVAAKST